MSSAGFGGIVLNPKLSHPIIMVMVKITLHTLLDFTKEETHNEKLNNFFFEGVGVSLSILKYPIPCPGVRCQWLDTHLYYIT